ncbi:multicopper oxidase family protein [Micromonospora echinofusca]|uniref:Multicopper oxidase CueO n=1 Tax=Micromonospora echinofusca TaxID=47858 RepID=A0ABS3VYP4_MICEH|nr:multicopper oxidase domain-containing protein [Micromonospora echinofusca]MBO4209494.1 multicopper oxidase domain-containing protein [Micromonospora echinofusca]
MNRRQLLALGGVAGGAVLLPTAETSVAQARLHAPQPVGHDHGRTAPAVAVRPDVSEFSVPMPLPPVLAPVVSRRDVQIYRLAIKPANVSILPGVLTPAYTYGGSFIGPTIRAKAGRRVIVSYQNQLGVSTNVHLHGAHVAASSDGYPMDLIEPGGTRIYDYPNRQQGATLWYHDHSHHTEAEHVFRGLHGFYLIEDEEEADLRLPSGAYDVPIMIRDAAFDAEGKLAFSFDPSTRTTLLVNGKPQPYFRVAARKYRFRLLNSASERVLQLNLGGAEMVQIASDGGLLPAPVPRTELVLASAERVELVVDFSRYPVGSHVVLSDGSTPLLRFDVVRSAPDNSRVPDRLRPLPALPKATVYREVSLGFDFTSGDLPIGVMNGRPFDHNRVDFRIKRGTTEIWNITNADPEFVTHTFHMHLEQFRVLERNGGAPTLDDAGRKDTVFIPVGGSVKIQTTFTDYLGKYVYHCHFLDHSSLGMMAQMEIVR